MIVITISKFSSGNHAFPVLCGKECYESMEVSFQELFEEINATSVMEGWMWMANLLN